MIDGLVSQYWRGAITAHHLVAESLCRLDPANPTAFLDRIPPTLLGQLSELIDQLRLGPMLSNYPTVPSPEQTAAAIRWLDHVRADIEHARVADFAGAFR